MHGDNIKPYKGAERLDWFQVPTQTVESVVFPCLQKYKRRNLELLSERKQVSEIFESFSEGVSQGVFLSPIPCSVDRVDNKNLPETCTNIHHSHPFPTSCKENGSHTTEVISRETKTVDCERSLQEPFSIELISREHLLGPLKRGHPLAPVNCYQSGCARDFCASNRLYMSKSARGDFHSNLDFEENRRVLIMGKDKKFSCNICQAKPSNVRNLRRHQKEAHSNRTKFFECPEEGCASTFLRRSYLTSHLKKKHGLVAAMVKAKLMGAPEQYCDASEYRRRGTPNKVETDI